MSEINPVAAPTKPYNGESFLIGRLISDKVSFYYYKFISFNK